jgi:hypothetical protein
VLEGAAQTLWRLRPAVFVQVQDAASMSAPAARLREFGYRCWRMETAYFNPGNFNRRDNDIFSGRTAQALLALPEEGDGDVAQGEGVELS